MNEREDMNIFDYLVTNIFGEFIIALLLFIIVTFWEIIIFLLGLGIFFLIFTKFAIIKKLIIKRKIGKIKESDVIFICSNNLYSIPLKVIKIESGNKNQWRVNSIHPELNNGVVDFVFLENDLEKVELPRAKDENDRSFKTAKSISYMTKEIYQRMNPRIKEADRQINKLRSGITLALSSSVYRANAKIYSEKIEELSSFVKQIRGLKKKYVHFIRESLIGYELSHFNLEADLEYQVKLDTEFNILNEQYEDLKNEIDAYVGLLNNK